MDGNLHQWSFEAVGTIARVVWRRSRLALATMCVCIVAVINKQEKLTVGNVQLSMCFRPLITFSPEEVASCSSMGDDWSYQHAMRSYSLWFNEGQVG